jgi:hypothetical protein
MMGALEKRPKSLQSHVSSMRFAYRNNPFPILFFDGLPPDQFFLEVDNTVPIRCQRVHREKA